MRVKDGAVTTLTIRIPRDLKKQVQLVSVKDDRSVTQTVCRALKMYLALPEEKGERS